MAKRTVFQRLNMIFGPEGVRQPQPQSNKYSINNDVLIKTQSKEEYDAVKLQQQQNKYLKGVWRKVDGELFQQSIHYETTRIGSYTDFESMEFYPEIAAALDVMMEEATTTNDKGKILNVYSDSNRIKGVLEDLFFNRLDIHVSLPMWTRNTCKYGDNFVLLNIDDDKGVLGARQLPNFEIERREGDIIEALISGRNRINVEDTKDTSGKVKFFWRGRDVEFNSWQIAHFRLLGDDRRLPYGTSMLEKARRIWKQLQLSEDAMLVYRVTRAPERRVYKIYVGNIDEEDVPAYVDEIANRFKRTPVIDPQTGQVDLRYNTLANDQDYFIPVRDENAPNPIDTLAGAANLDQIADIQYLQRKLFTALRVPKQFLNYDEAQGEGKNLSLQDVRFSRTINRIQQAMLAELNKIAIIHLYLLGFEDDLDNFTLTLNNPSTQAEMLKTEQLQMKMSLYKDAVSDAGNGFAPMSMTRAHREILGWSDDEIKQDLLEQRIEKAAAAELENTSNVIKYTGMFDKVDTIYGDINAARSGASEGSAGEEGEGGPTGGGGGFGGGSLDFGDEGAAPEGGEELGGDEGATEIGGEEGAAEVGGEEGGAPEGGEPTELSESHLKKGKLMSEQIQNKIVKPKNTKPNTDLFENLINSVNKKDEETILNERVKIYDKSVKINEDISSVIKDIDRMLDE
jgi:hypothetical protein